MFTYVAIIILLVLIGFSGYKVNEHKDDQDITKLALYSSAIGVASIVLAVAVYSVINRDRVLSRDMVTDMILDDFLNPTSDIMQ